jgi:hypothetical protein
VDGSPLFTAREMGNHNSCRKPLYLQLQQAIRV